MVQLSPFKGPPRMRSISCQGVLNRRFVLRRCQPDKYSGESCIVLQSWPTRSLVAKFHSVQSSLAVRKFRAAGKEHCKQGHGQVCAKVWCLMSWHPKRNRSYVSSADLPSDSIRKNLAWWAVTWRATTNHKTVKIGGWWLLGTIRYTVKTLGLL